MRRLSGVAVISNSPGDLYSEMLEPLPSIGPDEEAFELGAEDAAVAEGVAGAAAADVPEDPEQEGLVEEEGEHMGTLKEQTARLRLLLWLQALLRRQTLSRHSLASAFQRWRYTHERLRLRERRRDNLQQQERHAKLRAEIEVDSRTERDALNQARPPPGAVRPAVGVVCRWRCAWTWGGRAAAERGRGLATSYIHPLATRAD